HILTHNPRAPELDPRPPARLLRGHSPRHVFIGLMRDMRLNLPSQFRVLLLSLEISSDPHHSPRRPSSAALFFTLNFDGRTQQGTSQRCLQSHQSVQSKNYRSTQPIHSASRITLPIAATIC